MGGSNYPAYLKIFAEHAVRTTLSARVAKVARDADRRLTVTLENEYAHTTQAHTVDQLVVEHGTAPIDDVYFELKDSSHNRGASTRTRCRAYRPQTLVHNEDSIFQLFRVGDAVSSRNIHAAIPDSNRLCMAI
ncbi:hypothetical protein [Rhodococcus wratislaviensis]|uniref:hypothetical protein n=1 Tax=Rhodococcus wratislaviensis TaxID=44752 RepID=UPI00365C5A27